MLKSIFSQKNQGRAVIFTAVIITAAVLIAVMGKTELVENEDGTKSIRRSIFGQSFGK